MNSRITGRITVVWEYIPCFVQGTHATRTSSFSLFPSKPPLISVSTTTSPIFKKIQATHPIPPTLQPTLFFPRIPSIKIPIIPPPPSKTKKIPHCLRYLSLDQPHHQKSPFTPSYHPPIHPTPFRTLIFPDPAPFSAFPICLFSKPSIQPPPPPRITSSPPTTHHYRYHHHLLQRPQ